jgi:hypothetical protein
MFLSGVQPGPFSHVLTICYSGGTRTRLKSEDVWDVGGGGGGVDAMTPLRHAEGGRLHEGLDQGGGNGTAAPSVEATHPRTPTSGSTPSSGGDVGDEAEDTPLISPRRGWQSV